MHLNRDNLFSLKYSVSGTVNIVDSFVISNSSQDVRLSSGSQEFGSGKLRAKYLCSYPDSPGLWRTR